MDKMNIPLLKTQNIRNIIFDFGGVIINIDYHLTTQAFAQLGVKDFDKLFSQASQTHIFDRLETGHLTADEFRSELMKIAEISISDEMFDTAWNAMLLNYPKHRLNFLEAIKDKYRTFLLSNTNRIHQMAYYKSLYQEHGITDLGLFFEKLYFSHEVGLRKPGPEIYLEVLRNSNLNPAETLFIDDTAANLEVPCRLGMQVYHLSKGEDVVDFALNAGLTT